GMRQYAFEGACFVVSACGVNTPGSFPKALGGDKVRANGGSAIVGPDGEYLAGPVYDVEQIIYAEIDLEVALHQKHARDVGGHYARPDVLQLIINATPKPNVIFDDSRRPLDEPLEVTTADEVVDRLEAV